MRTVDFLDAIKRQHSITSDYATAQLLGLTRAQISRYRHGRDFMGDEMASKVALMLGLEPGYVVACAHAERAASDDMRKLWEGIAEKLQRVGLAGLLAVVGAVGVAPSDARAASNAGGCEYYVNSRRRRTLLAALARQSPIRTTQAPALA